MRARLGRRALLSMGLWLLLGTAAWASGEAHGSGQLRDFLFRCLDFGLTAALLYFVLRKPLGRALNRRREQIGDALAQAETLQAGAERRYAECRLQLEEADRTIAQLRESLAAESAQARQNILEQAQSLADGIRQEAARSAQREVERARKQLHDDAVALAVELAEELLKDKISPADQARLVDEYLAKAGGEL